MSDSERVVPLHPAPEVRPEERARRLGIEVERLARLSTGEWMLYVVGTEGYAERYGVDKATLKRMVEAVIKESAKKVREEKAERQRMEDRAEKQRTAKEREEERKADKEKQLERQAKKDADKKAEKKDRERQRELAAIAKLPKAEHAVKLAQLARRLGEDLEALRAELELLLADAAAAVQREAGEPWPEPVDTKELLDGVLAQLRRYIIIHDEHFAVVCALWVLFAWCHDIATYSPLLVIQSADSGAAKTHLTQAIVWLSPRGLMITEPTGPVLYRTVDRDRPTLGVDDADRLLPRKPDLAHIVNVSYTRGITIPRTEQRVPRYYSPFCPKVLNGIDLLPHLQSATRTRCIAGNLLPKLDDEEVVDFKRAYIDEDFSVLRRKAMRWAADNMVAIRDANPALPEGFSRNRQKDNYTLLFAIGDLAGGDWPKKIRAAAVKLTREHDEPSLGKCALAKFYEFFAVYGSLITSERVEKLFEATGDAEWCNYRDRGRPINKWEIAALLRPFEIYPDNIHPRGGKTTDRGYDAAWFEIAFRHYLGKSLPRGRSVARKRGAKPGR
jgi:hypothetical protein